MPRQRHNPMREVHLDFFLTSLNSCSQRLEYPFEYSFVPFLLIHTHHSLFPKTRSLFLFRAREISNWDGAIPAPTS